MSDTVKIVIEIDPHIIYAIQNNKGLSLGQQIDICNAIKNGIPLDDVKAEIDKLKPWIYKSEILGILDNIGKESEE